MFEKIEKDLLHFAAQKGDIEEVKKLIEEGFDVNRFDDLGMTPLHYAAMEEHLDIMKFLIDAGADVDANDETVIGNTPLGQVAGECSYEAAKILVDAGADPNIPGWMRLTALDRAGERKKPEGKKVQKLLSEVMSRRIS